MVNQYTFLALETLSARFAFLIVPLFISINAIANVKPEWKTLELPGIYEGGYLNTRLVATDKDSAQLNYQLVKGPSGLTLTDSGVIHYQPDFLAAGRYTVVATVSDSEHMIEKQWLLVVEDINRKPVILDRSPVLVSEGDTYEYLPRIKDEDNDPITISVENPPEGLVVENDKLIWQPHFEQAGNYSFTLAVSDGKETIKRTTNITVNNRNRPPYWETTELPEAIENLPYSVTLSAADLDGDQLTYRLVRAIEGLAIDENRLIWTPGYEDAGEYLIVLSVSDGKEEAQMKAKLAVSNMNREPTLPINDMPSAKEGDKYAFQFIADDPDGDNLTFSLTNHPNGMTISDSGLLLWTPDFSSAGQHDISLAVSDGETVVSFNDSITVQNTNRKPLIKTVKLEKAKEHMLYEAALSIEDPDGDPLTVTLMDAPDGMMLGNQETLSWNPDFDSAGDYQFNIQVSDGDLINTQPLDLQVENTNREPIITSKPIVLAVEGRSYRYELVFHDEDKDELSVELIQAPEGMSLKGNQLYWDLGYEDAGTVDVVWSVFEKANPTAKVIQRFVIEVANTNRDPVWKTNALQDAKEGQAYEARVVAEDADEQLLIYHLMNGPEGAELSEDGLLIWSPDYFQAGRYDLTLSVDDGETQVPLQLNLNVENTNRLPVITSTAMSAASENAQYSYYVDAFDADEDLVALTLLTGPKGMQLEEGVLSWIPDFNQSGSHEVILQASDSTGHSVQKFSINVDNTNRLPVWQVPSSEQLMPRESDSWTLPILARDPDGQKVRYKLVTEIDGLVLKGTNLRWKPSFDQAGTYRIMLEASDGENVEAMLLDVEVKNTNRTPSFASDPVINAVENDLYHYAISATDPDNDLLTYQLIEGPEGMEILDGELSWLPGFEASGVYPIVIEVLDDEAKDIQTFDLTVRNTNRAPEFISQPINHAVEMSEYQYDIDIVDADKQPMTLQLNHGPDGMLLKGNILNWSPDYYAAGSYMISLTVSDGDLSVQQDFELVVNNLNRLPVITSYPVTTAYESVAYSYDFVATDEDGESLIFKLIDGPTGMTISKDKLEWMPSYLQSGQTEVSLSVTDGIDTILQTFTINVLNTNREPTFKAIAEQDVLPNTEFTLQLEASDIDGSDIEFTLIHAPKGMAISKDNVLFWKPKKEDIGKYTIIVSVTDGDLKVRRYFDLYVNQID